MKKAISYSLLFFIFTTLNVSMLVKPAEVKIKGSVSDNAGLFPADMKINLWKKSLKLHSVKTDKFGNFEIAVPQEGEYSFILSKNQCLPPTSADGDDVFGKCLLECLPTSATITHPKAPSFR